MTDKVVSVRLTSEHMNYLHALSRLDDVPASAVVRAAIEEYAAQRAKDPSFAEDRDKALRREAEILSSLPASSG